jgi:hypothetical protein
MLSVLHQEASRSVVPQHLLLHALLGDEAPVLDLHDELVGHTIRGTVDILRRYPREFQRQHRELVESEVYDRRAAPAVRLVNTAVHGSGEGPES